MVTTTTLSVLGPWNVLTASGQNLYQFQGDRYEPEFTTNLAVQDLWAFDHAAAAAVGNNGSVFRYENGAWTEGCVDLGGDCRTDTQRAVAGKNLDDFFIIANSRIVRRYENGVWTTPISLIRDVESVIDLGYADGILFAAGNRLIRYDPETGDQVKAEAVDGAPAKYLWATSANHAVAAGNDGNVYVYDGGSWNYHLLPYTSTPTSVWGSSPSSYWLTTQSNQLFRYDGTSWTEDESPWSVRISELHGTGDDDILSISTATNSEQNASYFDGNQWVPVRLPRRGYRVQATPGRLFFAGNRKLFSIRRDITWSGCATTETCDNAIDDDCDGFIDVADSDCP
jgi:hypothetical protein